MAMMENLFQIHGIVVMTADRIYAPGL